MCWYMPKIPAPRQLRRITSLYLAWATQQDPVKDSAEFSVLTTLASFPSGWSQKFKNNFPASQ